MDTILILSKTNKVADGFAIIGEGYCNYRVDGGDKSKIENSGVSFYQRQG